MFSFTILFACTKTISVNEIAFSETIIEMTVGETYTPNVVIIPRNATLRNYTLTSSDSAILSVENNTITANVANEVVTLTATATDTSNGVKTCTVNVVTYAVPVQLAVPTQLRLVDNQIRFNEVENCTNYLLKINSQEIPLANTTYYNVANFDLVQNVRVKAVGTERATISSDYSSTLTFLKISKVQNVKVIDGLLSFSAISRVGNYRVVLTNNDTQNVQVFDVTTNSVDISSYISGDDYSIKVCALKSGYDTTNLAITSEQIYDGAYSDEIDFRKFAPVSNFALTNNTLTWNYDESNAFFTLNIVGNNYDETYITLEKTFDLYDLSIDAGQYSVEITAVPTADNLISSESSVLTFTKLQAITAEDIVIDNDTISWPKIDYASGYILILNGSEYTLLSPTIVGSVVSTNLSGVAYSATTYNIAIVAYGDNNTTVKGDLLAEAQRPLVEKLKKITNFVVNEIDDENESIDLSWVDDNENSTGYDLYIDSNLRYSLNKADLSNVGNVYSTSIDFQYFDTVKNYDLKIRVKSNQDNVFLSDYSSVVNVEKLQLPTNLSMNNDILSFASTSVCDNYFIELYKDTTFVKSEIVHLKHSSNEFLQDLEAGNYSVKVYAYGDGLRYLKSDYAELTGITKLNAPTLTITNNIVSFDAIDNASSYTLSVVYNTVTTNHTLTNDRTFTFTNDYESGEYELYVVAVGNGLFLDSDTSTTLNVTKLENVNTSSITFTHNVTDYTLAFVETELTGISKYELYLDGTLYADNTSASFSVAKDDLLTAKDYIFAIKKIAVTSPVNEVTYINSNMSANYTVTKIATPDTPELSQNSITFDRNGVSSTLFIKNPNDGVYEEFSFTTATYNLFETDGITPNENFEDVGEYEVKIKYLGNNSNILDSDESGVKTIYKLATVGVVGQSENRLTFTAVDFASGYAFVVNGIKRNAEVEIVGTTVYATLPAGLSVGTNDIYIVAKGDGDYYFDSNLNDATTITILAAPNLSLNNSVLTFDSVVGATAYVLNLVDSSDTYTYNLASSNRVYNFDEDDVLTGSITASVQAIGGTSMNFNSSNSSTLQFVRLNSVNMFVQNEVLVWNTVSNANKYVLTFENDSTLDFSTTTYDFYQIIAGEHTINMRAVATTNNSTPSNSTVYINSKISEITVRKLDMPTIFELYRGEFKYSQVEYANYYTITIGDKVSYVDPDGASLDTVFISTIYSTYPNRTETAKIISNYNGGDQNYIKSDELQIQVNMLNKPTGVYVQDNQIFWTSVANASGYVVHLEKNTTETHNEYRKSIAGQSSTSMPISELIEGFTDPGEYKISVHAYGDNTLYSNSEISSTFIVNKLDVPTGLGVSNGIFVFTGDTKAMNYLVTVYSYNGAHEKVLVKNDTITQQKYVLSGIDSGLYTISVQAIGNGSTTLTGTESDSVDVILLPKANNIFLDEGFVNINASTLFTSLELKFINNFNTYTKFVEIGEINVNEMSPTLTSYILSNDYKDLDYDYLFGQIAQDILIESLSEIPAGTYTLAIRLIGNTYTGEIDLTEMNAGLLSSETFSSMINLVEPTQYVKLPTPIVSNSQKGIVSWQTGVGTTYSGDANYIITITTGTQIHTFESTITSIDFNEPYFEYGAENTRILFNQGSFTVKVYMKGDDTIYINSDTATSTEIRILATPELLQSEGVMIWNSVDGATGYVLNIKTEYEWNNNLDGTVVELSNVTTFDFDENFVAGRYMINLVATSIGNNMINSKGNSFLAKTKLDIDSANFEVENGVLKFDRFSIDGFDVNKFSITIDTNTYILQIYDEYGQIIDERVSVVDNVIYYELPTDVSVGEHTILIYAIGDDVSILCSDTDSLTISKLPVVTNVHLTDGVLAWDKLADDSILGYILSITFVDELDNTVTYTTEIGKFENPTYTMPNSVIIGSKSYDLAGNKLYTFAIRGKGTSNYINSNAVTYSANRLADITYLSSDHGVVSWSNISNVQSFVLYYVQGANTYTIILDGNVFSYDFLNNDDYSFGNGEYTVYVKAVGTTSSSPASSYLTSRNSATVTFEKLTPTTAPTIQNFEEDMNIADTIFEWTANEFASGYEIEVTDLTTEEVVTYTVYTNSASLPETTSEGSYRIRVRTLTVHASKTNSEYSNELIISKPARPDEFVFNDDLKRFEWTRVDVGGDNYITTYKITYIFTASGESSVELTEIITANTDADAWWQPAQIGSYNHIKIQALSQAGFLSEPLGWNNELSTIYEFDLFASGSGTSVSPYTISTTSQFSNMRYYLNAHYLQTSNINFDGVVLTIIGSYNQPFGGYYDGDNKLISNINIQNNVDQEYKGIFGFVSNATIIDLYLKNSSLTSSILLSTNNNYFGLLAGKIIETTITNVVFENCTLNASNSGDIIANVGLLAGALTNVELNDISVISGNIVASAVKGLNVGGVTGIINNTTITNGNVEINIAATSQAQQGEDISVGGIVGKTIYAALETNQITNVVVTFSNTNSSINNDRNAYIGGAVGYNEKALIDKVTATVNISAGSTIGGLVGINYAGTIYRSTSSGNIAINAYSTRYIGGLVGRNNNKTYNYVVNYGTINSCYTTVNVSVTSSLSNAITYIGLLTAVNNGIIQNSFVYTAVGYGTISNVLNSGTIHSFAIAASVGTGCTISNCYYTQSTYSAINGSGSFTTTAIAPATYFTEAFVTNLNTAGTVFAYSAGNLPTFA